MGSGLFMKRLRGDPHRILPPLAASPLVFARLLRLLSSVAGYSAKSPWRDMPFNCGHAGG